LCEEHFNNLKNLLCVKVPWLLNVFHRTIYANKQTFLRVHISDTRNEVIFKLKMSCILTFKGLVISWDAFGNSRHFIRPLRFGRSQKWLVKIWPVCESGHLLSVGVMILGHLAALHWCKRSCFQEHQDYRRVSCWWAHQRRQGERHWLELMYSVTVNVWILLFLNLFFYYNVLFLFVLQGSSNSYAIKKKDELERVAKSNR